MCPCRSPPTLTGGATPSSTRSTRSPGRTPTATASATSPGSAPAGAPGPASASTPSGSPRGTPRRRPTAATTSPTTARIDPMFGDVADVEALVAEAHDLGIKVIVDIVPNHSSDQHVFFQEALASRARIGRRGSATTACAAPTTAPARPTTGARAFGGSAWDPVLDAIRAARAGGGTCTCSTPRSPTSTGTTPTCARSSSDTLRFWFDRGHRRLPHRRGHRPGQGARLPAAPARATGWLLTLRRDPGLPAVGPAGRARDLAGVAPGLQRLPPAAGLRRRGLGGHRRGAGRATSAPTSCTRRSTSTTSSAAGTPGRCARSSTARCTPPRLVGAPTTWVLENHDVPAGPDQVRGRGSRRADAAVQHRPGPERGSPTTPAASRAPAPGSCSCSACPARPTSTRARSWAWRRSRPARRVPPGPRVPPHRRRGGLPRRVPRADPVDPRRRLVRVQPHGGVVAAACRRTGAT